MNSGLAALRETLDATSVISSHYRSHVLMLAESAAREAFEAATAAQADEETVRSEQRDATFTEVITALEGAGFREAALALEVLR